MPFTTIEYHNYETLLIEYISGKVPPEAQHQVKLNFKIKNLSVIVFEERVDWQDKTKWYDLPIAKTTFGKASKKWKVYWQKSDLKWHPYEPKKQVSSLGEFLDLLENDKTGRFWG